MLSVLVFTFGANSIHNAFLLNDYLDTNSSQKVDILIESGDTGTKIAEKPIFGTFSFDNKAHGYENDDDTVLQLFTCASYDNLMKFMNMLRSNKWLSAQSKIPGGVTVGIRLV